jgi:hypothetical protein
MIDGRGAGAIVFALSAIAGLVGGCGKEAGKTPETPEAGQLTDISGWFAVTTYDTGPCGMTAPSNLGSPYVWIEQQGSRYVVRACNGTTEADCTGTYFYDFTQPIENGWHAEGGGAFFSAGCTLTFERADLTVVGNDLHATSRTYQINQNVPQEECTLGAARALTSPCTHEEAMTGTRL